MDYAKLAAQYGGVFVPDGGVAQQPAQAQAPTWAEGLSPKDQAEIKMKSYSDAKKRLSDLKTDLYGAEQTLNKLREFGELNRKTSTGGLWEAIMPGTPLLHGENIDTMRSISADVGPSRRVPGSGSSSDRDVNLFLAGAPSTEYDGHTNKKIRERFERQYNYGVKKAAAMEQHIERFGSLEGFDEQWGKQFSKQAPAQTSLPKKTNKGVKFLGFE